MEMLGSRIISELTMYFWFKFSKLANAKPEEHKTRPSQTAGDVKGEPKTKQMGNLFLPKRSSHFWARGCSKPPKNKIVPGPPNGWLITPKQPSGGHSTDHLPAIGVSW